MASLTFCAFRCSIYLFPKTSLYQFRTFRHWSSLTSSHHSLNTLRHDLSPQLWCHRIVRHESIKPPKRKWQIFNWKTVLTSGTIVAVVLAVFIHLKNEKMIKLEKERRRSLGKSAIGGSFELIDHNGKPCSSKDFLGKWILMYFGFTHCPDICPDEIEKMVKAVDIIEKTKDTDPIQTLFITVDPERDTTEAVKGYIREFSPKLIGLTGTKDQIEAATRAFRVYYSAGPRDHANDYIVDHTIIMYLINPDGEFVDYYGQTKTAEDISTGVMLSMMKYNKMKKKKMSFL